MWIVTRDGTKHCNGTLIHHHLKLYVWTVAHGLVDTSQSGLPLFPDIQLSLIQGNDWLDHRPVMTTTLRWTRAHHSYHLFDWQAEAKALAEDQLAPIELEAKRPHDVLVFELDPVHNDLVRYASFLTSKAHHTAVTGCALTPSHLLGDPPPRLETIATKIGAVELS